MWLLGFLIIKNKNFLERIVSMLVANFRELAYYLVKNLHYIVKK